MSRKMKLLFVEDNPVTMKSLSKAFEVRGVEVFKAINIEEAKEHVETEEIIDYLISDYDLNGENGLEAATAFNQKFPDSPIAIFTGFTDLMQREEVQKYISENPFNRPFKLLFKPIERGIIFEWITSSRSKDAEWEI